jgi:TetR/AcrR family transcriptional repressor of nem operon
VRYAKDRKEKTRAAGVDDVMGAAGLTAGGFYGHFPSTGALLAEALRVSLESVRDRPFSELQSLDGAEWPHAAVGRYLSRSHRDDPATGCPLPALAGEVSREGPLPRRALEEYLRGFVAELAPRTPASPNLGPEDRVLATVALLTGALMLSRAVQDRELSDRILSVARRRAVPEPVAGSAPSGRPGKPKKRPRGAE